MFWIIWSIIALPVFVYALYDFRKRYKLMWENEKKKWK